MLTLDQIEDLADPPLVLAPPLVGREGNTRRRPQPMARPVHGVNSVVQGSVAAVIALPLFPIWGSQFAAPYFDIWINSLCVKPLLD
jgi:hypothetical protein